MKKIAVIEIDKSSIIREFDSNAEEIFGYKSNEIIGKPLGFLIPEVSKEIHLHFVNNLSKEKVNGRPVQEEYKLSGLNKKGRKIQLDIRIAGKTNGSTTTFKASVSDLSNELPKAGKLSAKKDIQIKHDALKSEIMQLKTQLKGEKEKVRALKKIVTESLNETKILFKSFPDLIFILNYEGDIIELKGGPENELYLSPIYFTGKNISTFIHKETVNKFFEAVKNLSKKNPVTSFMYSMPIRGTLMHFQGILNYFTEEKILFVSRNITNFEESKKSLVKRDILLSALAKATNALLTIKDIDISVNKSLEILGEAVTVNRVYLFQNHLNEDGKLLTSQINEWCRNPAESQKDNPDLQNFDYNYIPRWKSLMMNGMPVNGLVKSFTDAEKEILEPQGIKSLLAIPIFIDKHFWGFIGFDDTVSERNWEDAEVEILKSMAFIFAIYIEQKKAEKDYIDKVNELTILNRIIAIANKNEELTAVFENILSETLKLLHFDGGGIYLVDETSGIAKLVYSNGISDKFREQLDNLNINNGLHKNIFVEGIPIFTENYKALNPEISKKHSVLSLASVPIFIGEKVVGAINVKSSKSSVITKLQKELLKSITDELSGAIQRRRMFDNLVQNDSNLNSFFNTIDDMLFVLDSESNIIKINDSVKNKLKYSEEELLGTSVLNVHIPEGREDAQRIVMEMLSGQTDSCSVPLISQTGEVIKVETKVKLGKWNNQDVIFGISRDISRRLKIEEALSETESQTKAMLDLIPDLIFIMSKDGVYLDYHAPASAGLYVPPSEFLGKNIKTIFHKELADKFIELFKISASTGEMTFHDYYLDDKTTGKRNYFEARILAYGDESKVLTIIRDITERKNNEKRLEESERKYRYLAENTQDIISLHTLDGTYEFISPSVKTILGYNDREIIGKKPSDIMAEDEAAKYRKYSSEELYKSNPNNIYEIRYKHKNGSLVWLEVALSQIKNSEGKTIKILSASRDITLRKKAEEEISATLEKEKKLNELKSNFISTTSHEFRTPLAAILSSTELLEFYSAKWTEEKKQNHYNKIKVSVNNMTALLNDILSFNKSESGNITFNRTETNVKVLCSDIIEEFKNRIQAHFNVEYKYLSDNAIHNLDSKLIKQAVDNLLNNAAKYSGEGRNISLIVKDEQEGLSFYVYDEGIGIHESDKDKLFEAFFRGRNAALIKGTGIGLPLVKRIAELHNGSIIFENNKPKGTVFKMTIKSE